MTQYFNFRLWILFGWAIVLLVSCNNKKGSSAETLISETKESPDTAGKWHSDFDIPEPEITPSPDKPQSISFDPADEVINYEASPVSPVAAILVKDKGGHCRILFWQIGQADFADSWPLPAGFTANEIKWHPRATALFVMGVRNGQYQILRIKKGKQGWDVRYIYYSQNSLQNLLVCPRPFTTFDSTLNAYYGYRLFFGESCDNGFRTVTVNENGGWYYQVVGPEKSITKYENVSPEPPSSMIANWSLPVAFHPAGHELIWRDRKGELFVARYAGQAWGQYEPMSGYIPTGYLCPTPNGLGFIHWQADKAGVGIYLLSAKKEEARLPEFTFVAAPGVTADGKGVIGLTKNDGRLRLNYALVQLPLPDVVNAWMYAGRGDELNLLQKYDGLFRVTKMDQLFQLYETENYMCGGYSNSTPTRPYLVTTDVFWEIYAAAYEGLFVVKERDEAIPDFWKFVEEANTAYQKTGKSRWAPVFSTLVDFKNDNRQNPEVKAMNAAEGQALSATLKHYFNYAQLKPRGHYTSDDTMKKYFVAFKYLTTAFRDSQAIQSELNSLPAETRKYAEQWIQCYTGFIAGSRTPLVWSGLKNNRPAYNQYPGTGTTIFPLSWGYDNEVLYSDVFHDFVPGDKQITGPGGPRVLPSGLDLASVMGSGLADQLLQSDYEKYPPLKKVITALRQNFQTNVGVAKPENLYDQWLNALARQWTDTLGAPNGKHNDDIWKAKRLQTGLASWATLRHATGLVNETGAAECGEGGFEEILLRAPRGYVEPDPQTLGSIAGLFEATQKFVPKGVDPVDDKNFNPGQNALDDGITKRLQQTAKDIRMFQAMAEKEKRGEKLTTDEYEKILFLGRVAEHNFLIFKSLLNKDYGLAAPDPISKIAEVFGDGDISPYLMAAVGNTMEWDNIVPFYGRHEIVMGSVYSYYEFDSRSLLNDKEWTDKVKMQPLQPWVNSFVTKQEKDNPATTGY